MLEDRYDKVMEAVFAIAAAHPALSTLKVIKVKPTFAVCVGRSLLSGRITPWRSVYCSDASRPLSRPPDPDSLWQPKRVPMSLQRCAPVPLATISWR